MLSNTRVIALLGGCIVALLILTSCQPGYSSPETIEETISLPEEIVETVEVVETVGSLQPTVEQQTSEQPPISRPTIAKPPFGQNEISQPTIERPTIEPEEIIQTPEKSSPKILLIDRMAEWNSLTYSRLIEIAASKGVEVDLFDNNHFIDISYDGIIVFGGGGGYNETSVGGVTKGQIWDLCDFHQDGGRFVFFALPMIFHFNDELRWHFGITVISEYITPPGAKVISVPGGDLSEMWSGLEIGSKTTYDEVSLHTYFKTGGDHPYTSMSNQRGEQRKTSISGGFDSGEFLFVSSFATGDEDIKYRNNGNFLHDGNIDGWDNQRAAEILIDWLVGNQGS